MVPRTEKQFEGIRAEKRQLILDKSLELFANNGYHSTSISKIANLAGISKGLIYNYFESKEDILLQLINRVFKEIIKDLDINNDRIIEVGEFKLYIENTFDRLKTQTEFWKLYFRISMQVEVLPFIKTKMAEFIKPLMTMLFSFFENRGYEDPMTEAMLFGALLDGIAMDYVFAPEIMPLDKLKDSIIKKYCGNK